MKVVRRAPHRGPEHEHEPQFGLPERLPPGERILWQGQPDAGGVMRQVFHLRGVALYFALMLAWLLAVRVYDGATLVDALRGSLGFATLAASAIGLLALTGWITARNAVYTLTDRRVVMRIGIVLTVTYNLPLRCIDGASLARQPRGARGLGDIALATRPDTRIGYLHLWPHARPWRLTRTEPMLRCVPDAARVAGLLSSAWAAANQQSAQPQAAAESSGRSQPLAPDLPALAPR